jgi:dynein heavy chain 1
MKDIGEVWAALTITWQAIDGMRETPWRAVVPRKLRKDLEEQLEKLQLLPNRIRQYATFGFVRATINGFLRGNLIVTDLRSEAIKLRHWDMLKRKLGTSWIIDDLTLGQIWDSGLQEKEAAFREVITIAQGELGLEEFLKAVRELWQNQQRFEMVSYQGKVLLVRNWEELFAKTADHLTSLIAMKASPYFKEFAAEAATWEDKLTHL